MKKISIAYAVFTRNIKEKSPIQDFLDNARKYKHQIDHLIIIYNDYVDRHIIEFFRSYCEVTAIQLPNKFLIHQILHEKGLSEEEIHTICATPDLMKHDLVPYGTARNFAIIAAIHLNIDFLLFFDYDVYPKILTEHCGEKYAFKEGLRKGIKKTAGGINKAAGLDKSQRSKGCCNI